MPFGKCFSCILFKTDEDILRLDYSNAMLQNVPPDVSQYERTLEELILSANAISDLPPELFYCQGLRFLRLNDNELTQIPIAIGGLKQLQLLDLSRNSLSYLPDELKFCKNLAHLDLSLNNIQRLPDAITTLISLQELLLNETYLDFLPANFGRLIQLRILELRSNNLVTLPKSMGRLQSLQRLDIGANEFTELPEVIGQLINLQELWCDYNCIRRMSSNIGQLQQLVHFEANNNQLTHLPFEIGHWKRAQVLTLSSNDLEDVPFSIGQLGQLQTLKLDGNQLQELPDSIATCRSLQELTLSQNFLSCLPQTMGQLRRLRFLAVDQNSLRQLPSEIASCSSLTVLNAQGNKLTELPDTIGHLTCLKVLNLVDNLLVTLPASLLHLTQLSALWISDNQSQPLVPLQFSDHFGQLTCFMLPQQLQSQRKLIMDSIESGHKEEQGLESNEILPPLRRIYFADEIRKTTASDTNADNDGKFTLIEKLYQQVTPPQPQHQTARLMRSPTPYPKELRLMSKYARHLNTLKQQQQHEQQQDEHPNAMTLGQTTTASVAVDQETPTSVVSNTAMSRVREARILSNVQPSDNNYVPHHSHSANEDTLRTKNHEASSILGDSQPIVVLAQPSPPKQQPPPYHIAKAYTKKSREDLLNYATLRPQPSSGAHDEEQHEQFYDSVNDNHHQQQHNSEELLQLMLYNNQVIPSYDQEELIPAASSQNQNNNEKDPRRTMIVGQIVSEEFSAESPRKYDGDDEGQNLCHYETGSEEQQSENNNLGAGRLLDNQEINPRDRIQELQCNGHSGSRTISGCGSSSSSTGQITQWLFGKHHNPTVKQVSIRKEPHLGFEITAISNQEGIFISSTQPNTQAASCLRANDKVLDVDGIDFTKMPLNDALKLLKYQTGPIVNVMISRK